MCWRRECTVGRPTWLERLWGDVVQRAGRFDGCARALAVGAKGQQHCKAKVAQLHTQQEGWHYKTRV